MNAAAHQPHSMKHLLDNILDTALISSLIAGLLGIPRFLAQATGIPEFDFVNVLFGMGAKGGLIGAFLSIFAALCAAMIGLIRLYALAKKEGVIADLRAWQKARRARAIAKRRSSAKKTGRRLAK